MWSVYVDINGLYYAATSPQNFSDSTVEFPSAELLLSLKTVAIPMTLEEAQKVIEDNKQQYVEVTGQEPPTFDLSLCRQESGIPLPQEKDKYTTFMQSIGAPIEAQIEEPMVP